MITLREVRENPRIRALIRKAHENLYRLGYTEHGETHLSWVAERAGYILRKLGYPERTAQLAEIAGYLHDMGAAVNRKEHETAGALLAFVILSEMGMGAEEVVEVVTAIGNHHEESGDPVSEITAAVILADKAHVHRDRVLHGDLAHDIHDRVNYAARASDVEVDPENMIISYKIEIDTQIAPVFEYFEIFTDRMLMARRAAKTLGASFQLWINGNRML